MQAGPKSISHAVLRGEFMKCTAKMEREGIPIDGDTLYYLREHWDDVRQYLAGTNFDKYDLFNDLHFSHEKFETFLQANNLNGWPRTKKSKARSTSKDTWETMIGVRQDLPWLGEVQQLIDTVGSDKLTVACDPDYRSRVLLSPFGAITSRNTPGKDSRGRFLFGMSKWVRFLIKPGVGRAVAQLDWVSQEFGISAIMSGDKNMLRSYNAGDPYMETAIQAGAAPVGATKSTHKDVRNMYKGATLGISYGQTPWGLAAKTGLPLDVATRVHANWYRVYKTYINWREKKLDDFGLSLEMQTRLGWTLHSGKKCKPNTPLNFTAQATGAEMMRLAVARAQANGVTILCPVHDALLIEAEIEEIEEAVAKTTRAMNYASALLLDGFVLNVACKDQPNGSAKNPDDKGDIARYPDRFFDEDSEGFWNNVQEAMQVIKERPEPEFVLTGE